MFKVTSMDQKQQLAGSWEALVEDNRVHGILSNKVVSIQHTAVDSADKEVLLKVEEALQAPIIEVLIDM